MSDDTYSFAKTLGIITAWDTISFGDNANIGENKHPIPRSRTAFTVDDIYVMLRKLKHFVDPKTIERLERMVSSHIADKNNPHGVTIDQLSTSVMGELYKDWLDYMNRTNYNSVYSEDELKTLLPTEQFLKTLFQHITIADIDTTLAGTSTYQVTSAKGVHELLKKHDADIDAHSALMEYLFPGAVHDYPPTFALMADVGGSTDITVYRDSTLSYMDIDGYIHTAASHTLPVDYSTGVAAYPIFGQTNNYCSHGSVLTSAVYRKANIEITQDTTGVSNIFNDAGTYVVSHTDHTDTALHTLTYTVPGGLVADHQCVCVSIFAKTGTLDHIGIQVYSGVSNDYNVYRYGLSNQTVWANSAIDAGIHAQIQYLTNGYSRCIYKCPIYDPNSDLTIDIHLLDILDGDLSSIGNSVNYLYLNGLQIEFDTDTASPYKDTRGSIVTEQATTISYNIHTGTPWYNPHQGGILVEVSGIEDMPQIQQPRYIYDFTYGDRSVSSVCMYYPAVHGGRSIAYFANHRGTMIYNYMFDKADSGYQKYGVSFVNSGHMQKVDDSDVAVSSGYTACALGDKFNTTIKTLGAIDSDIAETIDTIYIGCKGPGLSYLNGYMKQFIYYPTFTTPKHFTYFIKG